MPRIRTLKPEHRQHRKVGRLTDREYRLWVGMILDADDDGRLIADPAQLRVTIFGYHPKVTDQDVSDALASIARLGLVRLYVQVRDQYGTDTASTEMQGKPLAEFPSWSDHQRIHARHYTASKLPSFQDSGTYTGPAPYLSGTSPVGRERNGKERKGTERNTHALARVNVCAEFEGFWESYPRKTGKGAARAAWQKAVAKSPHEEILAGLHRNRAALAALEERYIPHPATWLNQERWNDEPTGVTAREAGINPAILRFAEGERASP